MSNPVSSVYRRVIDDVMTNVRGDFEEMGIDEAVHQELQRLWEHKVGQSRSGNFIPEDAFDGEEHDYEPTASLQYPPTAAEHAVAASLVSIGMQRGAMKPDPDVSYNEVGKPQPFLPPPAHPHPSHPSQIGRSNIPQTDGAWDLTTDEIDALIEKAVTQARSESSSSTANVTLELSFPEASLAAAQRALAEHSRSRQVDGNDDDDEQGDEPINSDLDDPDEDEGIQDNGEDGGDIILCQYDKVTRTKNKWKCTLKDGIMSINGRDFVFQRATGDFEW